VKRIFIKKCFLFTVGSVYRVKRFTTGSRNSLKDVEKSQMMPNQMGKWLRQQPIKDFCAAGFDAMVKQWDKYMSRSNFFRFEYHIFYVLYPFVTYLLTLPRIINFGKNHFSHITA
jgi:hypothetical protein